MATIVDGVMEVAAPQGRRAAFLGVRRRAAPILGKKPQKVIGGRIEVLKVVDLVEDLVIGHALEESVDYRLERGFAANFVIQCALAR